MGGEPISAALFEQFAKQKTGARLQELTPERQASLLVELEQLKAASQAGSKVVGDDFEQELELKRLELLSQRAAEAAGVFQPPSDAELRQAYESFAATTPKEEYRASHILVATQSAATILITKLQSGADFASLASQESMDDSKARAGDLGWIAVDKLPADFASAIRALQPGTFTTTPVHTMYGWHVIRLQEIRAATPPSLEQIKPQLIANLQQDRYQRFLQQALQSATR